MTVTSTGGVLAVNEDELEDRSRTKRRLSLPPRRLSWPTTADASAVVDISPRRTITAPGRIELSWPDKGEFDPLPARGLVKVEEFITDATQSAPESLVVQGDARDALPALLRSF